MDAGDIGSLGSASVALIALGVAVWGQRKASASEGHARRSADAVEESAGHARRSADAVERMAAALENQAVEMERSSPTPGVAWTLEHFQGDTYLLTNAGRGRAFDVEVDTGDLAMVRGDLTRGEMAPGEALKFMTVVTFGTTNDNITVTWSDHPGTERHRWSRPLPPRPPRR